MTHDTGPQTLPAARLDGRVTWIDVPGVAHFYRVDGAQYAFGWHYPPAGDPFWFGRLLFLAECGPFGVRAQWPGIDAVRASDPVQFAAWVERWKPEHLQQPSTKEPA
jgi:hypothetical protein